MTEDRVMWGRVVAAFVRGGWRPPPLTTHQAHRLIDDMERVNEWARATNDLTASQLRTLERVAYGDSCTVISRDMAWPVHTVKDAQRQARIKLGARNMANAVAIAIEDGLIRSETGWREAA